VAPASSPDALGGIADHAAGLGIERHGWGFHYCPDVRAAALEGHAAAELARSAGVAWYWWNAEKHWSGGADPVAAAAAFVGAFRAMTPDLELRIGFNGFWLGRKADRAAVFALFDAAIPMCYGTRRSTIARKFRTRGDELAAAELPHGWGLMVGSGRAANARQYWGYFNDGGSQAGTGTLVGELGPEWLAWWYGAGSEGMLTEGNRLNPAICDRFPSGACGV
jgi:hypothetical protein